MFLSIRVTVLDKKLFSEGACPKRIKEKVACFHHLSTAVRESYGFSVWGAIGVAGCSLPRDELLISPCQIARRGGRITMWLCCVIMKGECVVLPIIYHRIPAALSVLSQTFKAGTVWELTSWGDLGWQCHISNTRFKCAPPVDPRAVTHCSTAHRESDLLGMTEVYAAHRCCKGWISLANEPATYLPTINQSLPRRAACVWSTSHHHCRLGSLPPL